MLGGLGRSVLISRAKQVSVESLRIDHTGSFTATRLETRRMCEAERALR